MKIRKIALSFLAFRKISKTQLFKLHSVIFQRKIETLPLSHLQHFHNDLIYNFSFFTKKINYSWV